MSVRISEEDALRFGVELQHAIHSNLPDGHQRDTLIELVVILMREPMPDDFIKTATVKLAVDGVERELHVNLTTDDIATAHSIRREMWDALEVKRIKGLFQS